MSVSPIMKALAMGYAAPQVLQFFAKAFPSLAPRIKKAQDTGYSVEKILKMLHRGMGGGDELDNLTESQIHARRDEQQNQLSQDLAKTAVSSATAFGVGRALPGIAQGIRGAFGGGQPIVPPGVTPTPSPQPPIGPKPMANAPVQPAPIPSVGPNPIQATPPASISPGQPPVVRNQSTTQPNANLPPEQSIALIKEMGLEGKIKNLQKAGNPADAIAAALEVGLTPGQKKWFSDKLKAGEAKPLQELVKDYLTIQGGSNAQKEVPSQIRTVLESPGQQLDETQQKAQQSPAQGPKKGDLVFDESSGISGQLKDIKNKEALLDEDGKVHKIKTDKLLTSEVPQKDLADLYDDLITGIEKETGQDVSRNVEFAGYDPENNELVYRPHLGGVYVYDDISPEDVKLLTNLMTQRKTSGENFIGAWQQGSISPIGAAMAALIKRLQKERGGKGKEYSRKFQTIYNAHEPAQLAAKKKKAEEEKKKRKK